MCLHVVNNIYWYVVQTADVSFHFLENKVSEAHSGALQDTLEMCHVSETPVKSNTWGIW